MEIVTKPFTLAELIAKKDKNGFIKANIKMSLSDLIYNDIEWLNDEASERITDSVGGLTDISYLPIQVESESKDIVIEVKGNVNDFIEDEQEFLKEE